LKAGPCPDRRGRAGNLEISPVILKQEFGSQRRGMMEKMVLCYVISLLISGNKNFSRGSREDRAPADLPEEASWPVFPEEIKIF
jgi:hypothetical protein